MTSPVRTIQDYLRILIKLNEEETRAIVLKGHCAVVPFHIATKVFDYVKFIKFVKSNGKNQSPYYLFKEVFGCSAHCLILSEWENPRHRSRSSTKRAWGYSYKGICFAVYNSAGKHKGVGVSFPINTTFEDSETVVNFLKARAEEV